MTARGLSAALPTLLPRAIGWAKEESQRALREGTPLTPAEILQAECVGVARPGRVRVRLVDALPEPDDPALLAAGRKAGLLGPDGVGLTIGYAVFLRRECRTPRSLSHELRHVAQYESAGGIGAFLPVYLAQVLEFGYAAAPLERDARAHERD